MSRSTPKVLTCPVQIRTIHNLMNDNLPQEPKGLYLETFGCQMNVSESEKIVSLLGGLGYRPVTDPALADLILLNTCSVRAKAERAIADAETSRPCSSQVYQVALMPQDCATSSRRRPGVRRRPPAGRPRLAGVSRARWARRKSPSSRRLVAA